MKQNIKKIIGQVSRNIKIQDYKIFFYIGAVILTILFCIALYLTEGDALINFVHAWDNCTLMDFFIILDASPNSYISGGIYPPLAYIVVIVLCHCINPVFCEVENYTGVKTHQASLMLAIMCIIFFSISVVFICGELLKASKKEKVLFAFLVFFSIPMIFEIERLNILFVAWVFLGLFFLGKNSKNVYFRELSYICLAISAAIKIYPAIFGVLLIFEKRYKDTIRTVIYGLVIFFTPFLYFGGVSQLGENFTAITSNFNSGVEHMVSSHGNYNISYYAIGKFLSEKINCDVITIVQIILVLLVVIGLFFLQSYEKRVLLLVCLMIGIPNSSFCYVAIFMIFPIIFFLNRPNKKENIIYFILFVLMLFPLPIGYFKEYENKRQYFWDNVSPFTMQQMAVFVVLHIKLFFDSMCVIIEKIRKDLKKGYCRDRKAKKFFYEKQ